MATMTPPPPFPTVSRKGPIFAGLFLSALICGGLGFAFLGSGFLWKSGGSVPRAPALGTSPSRRFTTLSVNLAPPQATGRWQKAGNSGSEGGSRGTNTVDPALLAFKRVEVPPVEDLNTILPSPSFDPQPTFAGEATLPLALRGDGNPSGHGMGYGYGTGNGIGQGRGSEAKRKASAPSPRWNVMKKVEAIYPPFALKHKIQGYVTVRVTVDEQGSPIKVEPVKGNAILMAECLRVLMLWRFEQPAMYGLVAPASFPVVYKFELADGDPT